MFNKLINKVIKASGFVRVIDGSLVHRTQTKRILGFYNEGIDLKGDYEHFYRINEAPKHTIILGGKKCALFEINLDDGLPIHTVDKKKYLELVAENEALKARIEFLESIKSIKSKTVTNKNIDKVIKKAKNSIKKAGKRKTKYSGIVIK
jgi:hypothetical protein